MKSESRKRRRDDTRRRNAREGTSRYARTRQRKQAERERTTAYDHSGVPLHKLYLRAPLPEKPALLTRKERKRGWVRYR